MHNLKVCKQAHRGEFKSQETPPSLSYSRHNGAETGSLEWQNFIGTETSVAKGATIDRHNHSFLFYRNTSFYTSIWKVLF